MYLWKDTHKSTPNNEKRLITFCKDINDTYNFHVVIIIRILSHDHIESEVYKLSHGNQQNHNLQI